VDGRPIWFHSLINKVGEHNMAYTTTLSLSLTVPAVQSKPCSQPPALLQKGLQLGQVQGADLGSKCGMDWRDGRQ
jgi:hypothetical protein